MYAFDAETSEDWDNGFMEIPSKMARITTRPRFTTATLPDINEMLSDMIVEDKECDICGLDELTSIDLIEHWDDEHGLEMMSSVEEWNAALEEYEGADIEPVFTNQEDPPTVSVDSTSVSHAVSTAFQENMGPLRQDLENQLNIFKREVVGQVQNELQLEITKNITKLADTSSACSDKMSEILKLSSESSNALSRSK